MPSGGLARWRRGTAGRFGSIHSLPPATHAFRPERRPPPPGLLDSLSQIASAALLRTTAYHPWRMDRFVTLVGHHGQALATIADGGLRETAGRIRQRLHAGGFAMDHLALAFALGREGAARAAARGLPSPASISATTP